LKSVQGSEIDGNSAGGAWLISGFALRRAKGACLPMPP